MEIRRLDDGCSVSGQITATDLSHIAEAGFRTVICNRPDGEAPDQPDHEGIAAAARELGLQVRYMPVVSGQIRPEDVAAFSDALETAPGPVFAYCRTGTRCAALWSLDQGRKGIPADKVLEQARSAGYDLSGLHDRIAGGKG